MAGGRGTRFWPLSRTQRPKQLQALAGDTSLLRQTYDRVAPLVGAERVLVVTSAVLAEAVRQDLPDLPADHVIGEPVGRNTAPCAILGVGIAARCGGPGPVALLPADHAIPDPDVFIQQLETAFDHASATREAVTFGIPPTRPETGYGYLEVDPQAARGDVLPGVAFVEKPDRPRAEAYLAGGRHLWNSGIFVWEADAFLAQARQHLPGVVARLEHAVASWGTRGFAAALASAYADCPADSIDYALMEKLPRFAVVRARYRWSDLGSWSAWGELAPRLTDGNCGLADLVAVASTGNVVHAPGKLVALVGVAGLIVVDTGDALLVCRSDDDQRLKDVIGRLEAGRRSEFL